MGLGDEIMVTALAKKQARLGKRVCITDKTGYMRFHPVWQNNPNILHPNEAEAAFACQDEEIVNYVTLKNHSGHRHYIDHAASTPDRWVFKPWDIEPGEIFFDREEEFFRHAARPDQADILLDPGVKAGRENKMWPYNNWCDLAKQLDHHNLSFDINNPAKSPSIRSWLSGLTRYRLIITHEGGLHHAAAALGIPTIVLFGGFISPRITGYTLPNTRNLTHAVDFCGMIFPCQHCHDEMRKIKPEEVMEHVQDLLNV